MLTSLVVKQDNPGELLRLVDCTPLVDMRITITSDPGTGAKGATGLTHDGNLSADGRQDRAKVATFVATFVAQARRAFDETG